MYHVRAGSGTYRRAKKVGSTAIVMQFAQPGGGRSRIDSVLGAAVCLEVVEAHGAACIHVFNALADTFQHPGLLGDLTELLVSNGILDDELGLTVDGQDDGFAGLFQLINKIRRVLFKIRKRMNVPADVEHSASRVNKFLAHIREVDAIAHVLRCFEDGNVTHVEGSVDPVRDAETVETELMLADLDSLERRVTAAQKKMKGERSRGQGATAGDGAGAGGVAGREVGADDRCPNSRMSSTRFCISWG